MINSMLEADHETAWMGEKNRILIFTTINPDTANKAMQVLEDAGLLCSKDIGNYGITTFIKDH